MEAVLDIYYELEILCGVNCHRTMFTRMIDPQDTANDSFDIFARFMQAYSPKLPAAPGNTTGLSVPSSATDTTPK